MLSVILVNLNMISLTSLKIWLLTGDKRRSFISEAGLHQH